MIRIQGFRVQISSKHEVTSSGSQHIGQSCKAKMSVPIGDKRRVWNYRVKLQEE